MPNASASRSASRTATYAKATLIVALLTVPQLCAAVDVLHPLGNTPIQFIIGRVVSGLLGILGTLSLLMFVYGGFVWMTAAGNEEKIKKAKNTIVYSAIGLIVSFSSYAILRFLISDVLRGAVKVQTPTNQ